MIGDDEERRRRARRENNSPQDRGRQFHRGMAQQRGETRENGWRHEQTVKTALSERRHDTARTNERGGRDFTEYKFGNRVGGPQTSLQIDKDRDVLVRDPNASGTWVTKQGALDKPTRVKLERLVRDFPGRFRVVELSRADAERARREGKVLEERERSRQLELAVNVSALVRAQRIRDAARRARDRALTREAAQRAVDARNRMQRERRVRAQEREDRARVEREAAERVAREFAAKFPELMRGRDQPEENGTRERPDPVEESRRREERERAAAEQRQKQREAAERLKEHAQRARDAAAQGRTGDMSREVADLLQVGRPTPGTEPPHREPPQASQTRGGRDERGRERGIERDRGR